MSEDEKLPLPSPDEDETETANTTEPLEGDIMTDDHEREWTTKDLEDHFDKIADEQTVKLGDLNNTYAQEEREQFSQLRQDAQKAYDLVSKEKHAGVERWLLHEESLTPEKFIRAIKQDVPDDKTDRTQNPIAKEQAATLKRVLTEKQAEEARAAQERAQRAEMLKNGTVFESRFDNAGERLR